MTVKIIDTDASINLFERMRSFDCTPFFSRYEVVVTDKVLEEIHTGNSFRDQEFNVHELTSEEQELFDDSMTYMHRLGSGERSAMIHALFLSNGEADKIVVISNDKEAQHIFQRDVPKDPDLKSRFPNMERIMWVRTIDVVKKIWEEGLMDPKEAHGVYHELKAILGPKLNFILEEPKV